MAIPGDRSAGVEPVGKVRIGKKDGNYPSSLDHFRSNEALFAELCPGEPKAIEIVLLDEEAWNTGMEWWVRKGGESKLACYTKDSGDDPIAYRMKPYLDDDDVHRGPVIGANRQPISCPFRDCRHFGHQCKPIGRLTFYIASDPEKRPWRLDTKGWNSIEALDQALDENPGQKFWRLSVAFESKGTKRFPVLGMEPTVLVTEDNVGEADRIVALTKALATGQERAGLAAYLDATRPGWREDKAVLDRIKSVGAKTAAETIVKKAHDV